MTEHEKESNTPARVASSNESLCELTIEKMYSVGWHFGDLQSSTHSAMKYYVYKYIGSYAVIDIAQSKALFEDALKFINNVVSHGGKILFVGRDQRISPIVEEAAIDAGQFYMTSKWPGGLLTNWYNTFSKSIKSAKAKAMYLESAQSSAVLTKREHIRQSKKLAKKKSAFEGIMEMGDQLPNAVVVISGKEQKAIRECKDLNIPCIALLDTQYSPFVSHPVPGNSASLTTVQMFLSLIVLECKKAAKNTQRFEKKIKLEAQDIQQ